MKERIKKSNRYKRYLFYIKAFTAVYMVFVIGILIVTLPLLIEPTSLYNAKGALIAALTAVSLLYLPFIIAYIIKASRLIKNEAKYKKYTANIVKTETSTYIRRDYKIVTLNIPDLNKQYETKFYKGVLYDDVVKGVKCEILVNETNEEDIIILDVT